MANRSSHPPTGVARKAVTEDARKCSASALEVDRSAERASSEDDARSKKLEDAVAGALEEWMRRQRMTPEEAVRKVWAEDRGCREAQETKHSATKKVINKDSETEEVAAVPTDVSDTDTEDEEYRQLIRKTSSEAIADIWASGGGGAERPEEELTPMERLIAVSIADSERRAQTLKTLAELISEANGVDWRERARRRPRAQYEALERAQRVAEDCRARESQKDGASVAKGSSPKERRPRMPPKKFALLSDNSWVVDDGRSALDSKLRSILGDQFVEDDDDVLDDVLSLSDVEDEGSIRVVTEEDSSELDEFPHILTPEQMSQLATRALPPSLASCRWMRIYSLARDGDSFDTFLDQVGGAKQTLLVLRSTRGDIFGAYADNPLRPHRSSNWDAGSNSARTCLWRASHTAGRGVVEGEIEVYKWTGADRSVQAIDARSKRIAFGGGGDGGAFGLSVEDDFRRGTTARCGTFGNEPLCKQEYFNVVDVECWAFLTEFG